MDTQLQELIDKIKQEGVKNAEQQASDIVNEANDKAKMIIEKAEKDAERIKKEAQQEAAKFEANGKAALTQAGRDLLLKLQQQIIQIFDATIQSKTKEVFTGETLKNALTKLIQSWDQQQIQDLSILIPQKEFENLQKELTNAFSEEMKKGLEIKPFYTIDAGFYISEKDGSAYYDFSSEGLSQLLSQFLNPRLKDIIKEASHKE